MTPEALKFLNPDTRVFDTLSWIAARRALRPAQDERAAMYTALAPGFLNKPWPIVRSYTLAELRAKFEEGQPASIYTAQFLNTLV